MDRQVARRHALMDAGGPAGEGWASVQVLDRSRAASVAALRFEPAFDVVPQTA